MGLCSSEESISSYWYIRLRLHRLPITIKNIIKYTLIAFKLCFFLLKKNLGLRIKIY
jgi:hypothetical protein